MGAAAEIASGIFRRPTRTRQNDVTTSVTTAVTRILDGVPDRLRWAVYNLGNYTLYIGLNEQVSATNGVPVLPLTGFAISDVQEDGEEVVRPVFAVAPGGATTILSYETIAEPGRVGA